MLEVFINAISQTIIRDIVIGKEEEKLSLIGRYIFISGNPKEVWKIRFQAKREFSKVIWHIS